MKISYRTHPGIKAVETASFRCISNDLEEMRIIAKLTEFFKDNISFFKPIRVISKTMVAVINSCGDKMTVDSIWRNIGAKNGTICFGDLTFCYAINSVGEMEHDYMVFLFREDILLAFGWQDIESDKSVIFIPESAKPYLGSFIMAENRDWREQVFHSAYTVLIAYINFLQYADVQEKVIKAESREKGIDCKYINETKLDVEYITSHYITDLYVAGAFNVSGHWRLQPKKKDGEWTKEIIWINEFQKKGYTRKAGITKKNEE